jgi:hypothetical protein
VGRIGRRGLRKGRRRQRRGRVGRRRGRGKRTRRRGSIVSIIDKGTDFDEILCSFYYSIIPIQKQCK